MPPAKKAAKAAAHHAHERSGRDLRRAFEHFSRVQILQRLLTSGTTEPIATLVALAVREIESGQHREAADFLRASEHLSFALLASAEPDDTPLSAELMQAIEDQFEELNLRAEHHRQAEGEPPEELAGILEIARQEALHAFRDGAWHRALELARAVEALSHIHGEPLRLPRGKEPRTSVRERGSLNLVAPR